MSNKEWVSIAVEALILLVSNMKFVRSSLNCYISTFVEKNSTSDIHRVLPDSWSYISFLGIILCDHRQITTIEGCLLI